MIVGAGKWPDSQNSRSRRGVGVGLVAVVGKEAAFCGYKHSEPRLTRYEHSWTSVSGMAIRMKEPVYLNPKEQEGSRSRVTLLGVELEESRRRSSALSLVDWLGAGVSSRRESRWSVWSSGAPAGPLPWQVTSGWLWIRMVCVQGKMFLLVVTMAILISPFIIYFFVIDGSSTEDSMKTGYDLTNLK